MKLAQLLWRQASQDSPPATHHDRVQPLRRCRRTRLLLLKGGRVRACVQLVEGKKWKLCSLVSDLACAKLRTWRAPVDMHWT